MLRLGEMAPLAELFALDQQYSAEEFLELKLLIRPLVIFQQYPDVALTVLSNVTLPPHQRTILNLIHHGAGSNVILASRGTAKSSTVAVLYAQYIGGLFPRRKIITLSYTGFRGGQQLFMDAETFLHGGWDSQRQEIPFLRASISRGHKANGKFDTPLYRGQNLWQIAYDSFSTNTTLPTKEHDAIRGQRGNDLILDEANFLDKELIEKVAIPFLNVTGDFEGGGENAAENRVFYISTVDYSWRPFQLRIEAARAGLKRDYDAYQAAKTKNWRLYNKLENDGLHEHTFMRLDYTDTLVRRYQTNREGKHFEVVWPNPKIRCKLDRRGIPFTERNAVGLMSRTGRPIEYYRTYPVEKKSLERNLRDGSADESSWKAENRNVVDTAIGDVYSNTLIDVASCFGDRCLTKFTRTGAAWRERFAVEQRDFVPPILWRCESPCVIGIDYAPFSDFCAFVVIRVGPIGLGDFDELTCDGKTSWSNVIWAEQHRQMTHEQVAEKIRALGERYNLMKSYHHDPYITDTWEACRAIGLDMRGGGTGVRDALARLSQEYLNAGETRIYDPFDKDEKVANFGKDATSLPMLDAIFPTAQLNEKLVEYTKGQMEAGYLYLPKYFEESQRPTADAELHMGYEAAKILVHQLRKIRQRPTQLFRQFYMDGDSEQDKNKKDLFSAFLYAAKQMRALVIRQSQIDNTPPPLAALISHQASRRGNGRAPGSRG